MGRANYVILAMGIATVLILSFMMKHLLHVTESNKRSPVADEVMARFGDRLDAPAEIVLQRKRDRHKALVHIQPVMGAPLRSTSTEIGEFLWTRLEEQTPLVSVEVFCRPWSNGGPVRFVIPRPDPGRSPARSGRPGAKTPVATPRPGTGLSAPAQPGKKAPQAPAQLKEPPKASAPGGGATPRR